MIYLDSAATAVMFKSAAEHMCNVALSDYYNPSSVYASAAGTIGRLNAARRRIAEYLNADAAEVFFTSGATESNNWTLRKCAKRNCNIVITAGEHSSVYETAMELKCSGTEVRIAPLDCNGRVNLEALKGLIDQKTALVSLIHLSNETGAVNPIFEASRLIKSINPETIVHSDGAQAFLKTRKSVGALGVDLYSASAHKLGGPKGIGFLYVKNGRKIAPLITGGGQECGLRSGTENTAAIAGFVAACDEFNKLDFEKIGQLKARLAEGLATQLGERVLINSNEYCSDFILSVCFKDIKAEVFARMLYADGLAVGTGSACASSKKGNRVLTAMKIPESFIEGAIRFSFGALNDERQIDDALKIITKNAKLLKDKNVR